MSDVAKRQKVVHLTPAEQCRQRPDMYIGSVAETNLVVPTFGEAEVVMKSIPFRLGFLSLMNELSTNALDNQHRPGKMTYISIKWDGTALTVENDGATLSVLTTVEGQPELLVAFGWMHSGTNFDQEDTGKKANKYTAGRNGVGGKACLVFCKSYEVTACNTEEGKELTVKWEEGFKSTPRLSKIKEFKGDKNKTRVVWTPDLSVLGTAEGGLPEHMDLVCSFLAHNASLCANDGVVVKYNGRQVKARGPEQFCKLLGASAPLASCTVTNDEGLEVLRLCVGVRATPLPEPETGLTYAFVNSTPCPNGSHETLILRKVCDVLNDIAKKKRTGGVDIHITPLFLLKHAVVVATVLVDNEQFTNQTKRTLATPVKDYGWKWGAVSESFALALGRAPFVERAVEVAKQREFMDACKATKTSKKNAPTDSKYEPAQKKGTPQSTLIVCEGDSAANLVRSGLSVVGRKHYGLYPLRGKFLNVRGVNPRDVMGNKEAMSLLRILGIQLGVEYDDAMVRKLPYQRLMVMSDQDVDGSHIAGLVFNFVDVMAPSLLIKHPNFMYRFATALIRVNVDNNKTQLGFYSQTEYDEWVTDRRAQGLGIGTCKYFKGLGTSSATLAKEYFRNLSDNIIVVRHSGAECGNALDMAFNKKRSDHRKEFLTSCDPKAYVDYKAEQTTVQTFIVSELLPQYALASLVRAIPSVVDGFKEALRKSFYGARILKIPNGGLSVANAAGEIASKTKYHHRATALEDTIIGMAADYAGTSNVNLLLPLGQFGTRFKHQAASAAYPLVALNAPLESLLFPPADDSILAHVVDEGYTVEPRVYTPVIAMALVQGARGIATGWSTDVPQFHPVDIVDATLALLDDKPLPPLVPWYRGFTGPIVDDKDGQFSVSGVVEWIGNDLHVHEVPPFREVEAYKDDWIKAAYTDKEIHIGKNGTDEVVHLVLVGCTASRTDTLKELGLIKKIGYNNMHLLDARGVISKYETPEDILRAHSVVRLSAYEERIAHEISVCEKSVVVAEAKMRFIQYNLDDSFVMKAFDDATEAAAGCGALGLPEHPIDGGFSYLLNMTQVSLVTKNVEKYRRQAQEMRDELERLLAITPTNVWREELGRLRDEFDKDSRYARSVSMEDE